MRLLLRFIWAVIALNVAHSAIAQLPVVPRSAKEVYEEILQRGQLGSSMMAQAFARQPVDEKQVEDNFLKGIAAETELETLAKQGDFDARYFMGLLKIHYGLISANSQARTSSYYSTAMELADQQFKEAVVWLKPLAEKNVPGAQWAYGQMYADGHGVNKSSSNAIDLWFKAAQTYLSRGDRENALTLFDMMRGTDEHHPQVVKLQKLLFQN